MTTAVVPDPAPRALSRFKKIAPYLLLGPISGLLVYGAVHSFRDGRLVAAGLYGAALVAFSIGLPYAVAFLGLKLI